MALLDFPSGPTQDVTTYTLNGNTWKWNGTSWVAFNNLSLSSQVSGILAVQYGGTGFGGTYTTGDILYALSSNTFGKLTAGTAGSVLASGGPSTAPYWKADDSGTGSVGNGNTGGFAYYTSLNTVTSGTAFSYISGTNNVILTNGTLSLTGSTVNSGTWAGNAITAKYGGTGLNAISAGQLIYGSGTDTFTTLSHSGTAGSILVTTGSSGIAWTLGSSLTVGIASSSVLSNITGDTTSTLYLLGSRSSGGFAGTAIYVDSGISALGNTLTATTFVGALTGTATTATRALNTDITLDTTSQIFLTGSRSNSSIGSTPTYVLSGVSALGNTVTATTFVGALTGTASIATSSVLSNTTTDTSSTLYLLGSRSSTGFAGTAIYVDSSISVLGNTVTGNLTGTASIASSSVLLNTTTDTSSTLYLLGSRSSTGFAGTAIYVDSSVSVLGNTVTATTFSGNLTGTASIASSSVLVNTTTDTSNTLYLLGSRTSTGFAGTGIFVDSNASIVGNTITANLTGTATTATRALNTDITLDTTSQIFLTGSRSNSSIGSTATYVLSGVSALGNTVTATTFVGALTGTASIATSSVLVNTTTDTSSTLYLLGSRSSTGFAGTAIYVDSSISVVGNTITATTFSGNLSGTAVTATHYGSGINLSGIVTSLAAGSGIQVSASTGAITVSNIGVTTITGTANQVSVSSSLGSSNGAITLSLPQNIATSSAVQFETVQVRAGTLTTTSFTAATDIVNKQYVDNLASGLDIHKSMRVLQTAAIGASYIQTQGAGSAATSSYLISTTQVALPAIDGVTISSTGTSQRILITGGFTGNATIGGTTPFTPANSFIGNGAYYVAAAGGAGTNWILIRTTDSDDNTELTGGTFTFIEEGTSYKESGWVCSNDTTNLGPIQFGSTAIEFTQFTGAAAFVVGQGLNKVGNTVASKINITSTGTASGTGFSQFNIGGASVGGVADTGYYPTFSVRTSGTSVSGSALLTLNSDGFSLIGSTSTPRTITVTGSDITLTGGGNTLTLTGNISLPTPQQYRLAYGLSGTAISFLPVGGASSVLFQTNNTSDPIWVGQSTLSVGNASIASSAVLLNTTTDTSSTLYLLGSRSSTGFAGTAIYVDSSISVLGNTVTGNLTGTASIASSSVLLNTTTDTSSTLYLLGSRSSTGFAGTAIYVDSSVSVLGNTVTATTFSGNLTGTASIATSSILSNTTADTSSTLYLLGTRTNGGFAGTGIFVDNSISVVGNTMTANLTGTATTATRALNTDITLDTTNQIFLTGSRSNSSIGSTPTYVLSGVSALGNTITATTFVGALTGTASIASSSVLVNTTTDTSSTLYLLGSRTSTGFAGTGIFVDSSASVVGNTITANLTGTASIASSSVLLNTTTDTSSTLYLLGSRSSTGFAGTAIYVDTNVSIVGNTITATLSGTATTATRVGITTTVSNGDLPIVFASDHQPSAALGSSTRLTINPSTGKITNGFWAGTAITTKYGGTGLDTVNANQLLIGASTGNTWAAIGSSVVPVVAIGAAAPAQPGGAIGATQAGQLWWDSEYGVLKVYYVDATPTAQWVDATPVLGSSGGGSSTKRSYVMTFGAGFTPSTGADTVQILIPYAPDNTSKYYYIKRLDYRANTAGTGVSFYMERFTGGNAAFDVATGNRIHSGAGASFVASSGTFTTSYTQSSSGASFVSSSGVAGSVISGDYLRLNFSHINSAATMSVSIILEEQ